MASFLDATALGPHVRTRKGFAFKSKWYSNVGRPIVKVSDFTDDSVDASDLVCIPEEIAQDYLRYELREGDVVVQTVGSWPSNPRSVVGKAVRIPSTAASALLNQNAVKLVPDDSLDKRFLFYLLRSPQFKNYIIGTAQGAASQASITLDSIMGFTFDCLELPVQQKIAAILCAYDDLIENSQRRIEILEVTAQALYHEWFLRFGFPGRERVRMVDTSLGEIPEGWKVMRLGELVEIEKGKKPKVLSDTFEYGFVPYLLIDSMKGRPPQYTQLDRMVLAEPDDVVMVMDGASSGVARCGVSGAVGSTLARMRPCDEADLSPFILLLLLKQREDEIRSKNVGAAIPHANKEYLSRMEIALPPRQITKAFDQICRPLFGLVWNLTHANQTLRNTRDLLLTRLVSGELDVSDLNIDTGALDT